MSEPFNLRLILGLLLSVIGLTACESNHFYSGQSVINQSTEVTDLDQAPEQNSSQLDKKASPSAQLEQPTPQVNESPTSSTYQSSQNLGLSSTDYTICQNHPNPSLCISQQLQTQQEADSQTQEDKKILKQRQKKELEQQEYERKQADGEYLNKSYQPQQSSPLIVPLNQPQQSSTGLTSGSQSGTSSTRLVPPNQRQSSSTSQALPSQSNNSSALPATLSKASSLPSQKPANKQ